jgi:hypothetical protein
MTAEVDMVEEAGSVGRSVGNLVIVGVQGKVHASLWACRGCRAGCCGHSRTG